MANAAAVPEENAKLLANLLPQRRGLKVNGQLASELGSVPILHMRHFMTTGELSEELVKDIQAR